ncbi:RHS repeat-associated core domain-containing protein [Snodgrassella sp. CS2]|uniref:RHS repeat-associated core domain-containing protein n=1 Tax=Snodgrassella sp. CS2 TaxID=3418953 RepID=UPI003CFDEFDE
MKAVILYGHAAISCGANRYRKSNAARDKRTLRYQGQHLDRETGLHYNTFRYYDSDIGRFTQPNPIGLLDRFNLY